MRSHKGPSAPGRTPWPGADLVEGPNPSDRHGPLLEYFGRHGRSLLPPSEKKDLIFGSAVPLRGAGGQADKA